MASRITIDQASSGAVERIRAGDAGMQLFGVVLLYQCKVLGLILESHTHTHLINTSHNYTYIPHTHTICTHTHT